MGVASVTLLVNGTAVASDTAAPYEFSYVIPTNVTSLTLAARAVDFGNNTATSPGRVVAVIPDPGTTVNGRVLDEQNIQVIGEQLFSLVDEDGMAFRRFSVAAQNRLRNYPWPGNVRELRNLVQRMLIIGGPEEIGLEEIEQHWART